MKNSKIKLGIINSYKIKSDEINSVLDWLKTEKNIYAQELSLDQLSTKINLKSKFDLIWWHYDEEVDLPEKSNEPVIISNIFKFVQDGGGLLLSLIAAQYIHYLGIESQLPDVIYKGEWDKLSWVKEYPDIRGFHCYLGHSIFKGLNRGVYTWNPQKDENYCEVYYSENKPSDRKTAAIGRAYISFEEDLKLINEYSVGKGKILTIGSYFFFSPKSRRFQTELRHFTMSCLYYLKNHEDENQNTYWENKPFEVISLPEKNTGFKIKNKKVVFTKSELEFSNKPSNNYYDLSGRRTLLMGDEKSGISEIWFHPFRGIKSYNFSLISKENKIKKDGDIISGFTCQPASIKKDYNFEGNTIEEIIFTSLNRPGVLINYQVKAKQPIEIIFEMKVDLRYMWPYSANILGSINYYWDKGLRCFVIMNQDKKFFVHIGCGIEPDAIIAGRYSSIRLDNGEIEGIETEEKHLLVGFKFCIQRNHIFSIVLSGSNISYRESLDTFKYMMEDPVKCYNEQNNYYKNLFRNSTLIDTPNEEFNLGYKWGLVGIDKFFVKTPPLGDCFMAGYASTKAGWGEGRPGYAWYFGRDSIWTCFAVLKYGDFDKVKETIKFLGNSQNVDGKIFHELTSSGCIHYDAADSTPLYIILCGYYLKATGDLNFIKIEWEHIKKAIDFCFSTDTDKDHLIENTNVGHGWVEGGDLFPIHSETYLAACWTEALKESAFIAESLKINKLSLFYEKEFQLTKNIINESLWNPETNFFDLGIDVNNTNKTEKTALISIPLLFGLCDLEKSNVVLQELAGSNFSTDWGIRIIREESKLFNPKGYHYGAVWPLFTGWTSLAEYKYGRSTQGYAHLMSNLNLYKYWSKGYLQEVLNGYECLPSGVCPHQAWSESMVLQPALEGMLGFSINVLKKELYLSPNLPQHWENLSVKNIKFGKGIVNFHFHRTKEKYFFEFSKSDSSTINVIFAPYLLKGIHIEKISINSKPMIIKNDSIINDQKYLINFRLKDKIKLEIDYSGGIMVLPNIPKIVVGGKSKGLKIINEELKKDNYRLNIEGKRNQSYIFQILSYIKIDFIEGGEIATKNRNIYSIKVEFEDSKNKYYNKEVILILKR